jgi:hypothetical protein
MRVVLDLDTGLVCLAADYVPGQTAPYFKSILIGLGDNALEVRLMRSGSLAQLLPDGSTPASLTFVAKAPAADGSIDFDSDPIVQGSVNITGTQPTDPALFPILNCGEDWSAAALVALFDPPDLASLELKGQFRWKNGADSKPTKSRKLSLTIENTLFQSDIIPGAVVLFGNMYYLRYIKRLTGGVAATDADAINISTLQEDDALRFMIPNRGESSWQVQTDLTSPVTDTDAGIIVPINYHATLRPYVLRRQSGY